MFGVKRRGEGGWRWGFAGYQCSSSSPGSTALTWVQSDGIKEQQGELTEGSVTLTNTLEALGQTDVIMIRNEHPQWQTDIRFIYKSKIPIYLSS